MTNEGSGDVAGATLRQFSGGQTVFGRYTLIKILGRGGMGIVWLARDEELEREVALKFLPDLVVQDRALLDDIKRETRRNLKLTHRNIVRVYDFLHDEASGCISMEYVDGDTLSNLRAEKEQGVCETEEIAGWVEQLCDALDYAHNHTRIIHGDLRPANLMVNQKSQLKVSDFAIARSLGDSISRLTMTARSSGTLSYMSPQQLDGQRASPLDDVYSVGATLYDLLTGKPPFYSGDIDRQIREGVAPSMAQRRKEFDIEPASVPAVWEEVVAGCLAKDPTRRPQSTAEVAQRLQLSPSRTAPITVGPKRASKTSLVAATVAVVAAIAVAALYLAVWKQRAKPAGELGEAQVRELPEKSVAVLPFENLSRAADDAYLASGIQDEIITRLGKIGAVKPIARTSTKQYESKPTNRAEIGKQLGAATLLESNVQKEGDQLRVNVKLINASSDSELWTESYLRTVNDIVAVASEVASKVASTLRVPVSAEEKARISDPPTVNPDAYALYLRARALADTHPAVRVRLYEQAVGLDPNFALAYAALSTVHSYRYNDQDPIEETKVKAREAAEQALRLQPALGEAHAALGAYCSRVERNYKQALEEYTIAEQSLPNDFDLVRDAGLIRRRLGLWRDAVTKLDRVVALDPRNAITINDLAETYLDLREWDAAEQTGQRVLAPALAGSPRDVRWAKIKLGWIDHTRSGSFAQLHAALDAIPAVESDSFALDRWTMLMLEHDFDAADRLLAAHSVGYDLDQLWIPHTPKSFLNGCAALAKGDFDRARSHFEAALPTAEAEVKAKPSSPKAHSFLGLIHAYLGQYEEAIREGRRAVELLPQEKDAYEGPKLAAHLAEVYARTGELDLAMSFIERLLVTPASGINLAELRSSWRWDPLREHPRFQKILASPEPKIVY